MIEAINQWLMYNLNVWCVWEWWVMVFVFTLFLAGAVEAALDSLPGDDGEGE